MTRSDSWTRVGSVAPAALRDATIQLHWAAQVLAAHTGLKRQELYNYLEGVNS